MTPVLSRGLLVLGTVFSLSNLLTAKEWTWQQAIGATSGDDSKFTSIVAVPGGPGGSSQVYVVGNYEMGFSFDSTGAGPGQATAAIGDAGGTVVRRSEDAGGDWQTDWLAAASAPSTMQIHDVAAAPDGATVFVCGRFENEIRFTNAGSNLANPARSLAPGGGEHGFLAWLDAASGDWIGSSVTPGIIPRGLVVDPDGGVILSGPDLIATKMQLGGVVEWATSSDPDTSNWKDIEASADPADPFVYVLTRELNPASEENVVLTQIDRQTGAVTWTRRMGGPGDDIPGGLAVSHNGHARVAFTVEGGQGSFDGQPVSVPGAAGTQQTLVARVRPDGHAAWVTPVGSADPQSSFSFTDMVVDPIGNTWAAGILNGAWTSFGEGDTFDGDANGSNDDIMYFTNDAVMIAIDGRGEVFEFHRSGGLSTEVPKAIAAPDPDTIVMAGFYLGFDTIFGSLPELDDRGNYGAFCAVARAGPGQQLVRVRPNPGVVDPIGLRYIKSKLWQLGVRSYVDFENGDDGTVVSAKVSAAGIADLQQDPNLIVEVEAQLSVNGVTPDAGWGLARLNDGGTTAPPSQVQPYVFPETDDTVILYLVDTAVSNPNNWFDGNTNVTVEDSILIRGAGDPTESSEFEHGTRMLSMIAGPETGVALGTDIRVINYDIYPNGSTTTSALMAKAVIEAVQHHQNDTSGDPGVVCIASSSESGATSPTLEAAVDLAIAEGLVVVVSAGNEGEDVDDYIPASYGSDAGVICVGGSDQNNARLSISNYGTAIDLFAPGLAVRNLRFSNPVSGYYDEMTGTSASTALAAAAAAVEFSRDTLLTPSGVESALVAGLYDDTVDVLQVAPLTIIFGDWSELHGLVPLSPSDDADNDGIPNLLEYFHGCDPTKAGGSMCSSSVDTATGKLSISFPVSNELFDSNDPYVLLDGTAWEVELSCDLVTWSTATGTLTWGTPGADITPVSFETSQSYDACFLRIKVVP